jgi:signal transduction histidine kinase
VDGGILTLEVTDNGNPDTGVRGRADAGAGGPSMEMSNGHDIVGMRERATALGGCLRTVGPSVGGFSVRAQLPARLDA